jgi:hypothetical protein
MSQLDTIIFILSLAIGSWGCVNNPIETVTVNGQNFISCNIDLIEETSDLKLSDDSRILRSCFAGSRTCPK